METLIHFFTSFDVFEIVASYFLNMIRPLAGELTHPFLLTFILLKKFWLAHPTLIVVMLGTAITYGGYALIAMKRKVRLLPIR